MLKIQEGKDTMCVLHTVRNKIIHRPYQKHDKMDLQTMRTLRQKKSLSQENVAEISGLHVNTIHLLEKGKSEPKLGTFIYIAKALEVTLSN